MKINICAKKILIIVLALSAVVALAVTVMIKLKKAPETAQPIFTGYHGDKHIQGIAVDEENGYIYYSFTTKLIKSDMNGNVIGSIEGFAGHLGCLAFNKSDGKVYASLEYKHDSIGNQLIEYSGIDCEDGFYIASFDVDKITQENVQCDSSDIMQTVFLPEVLNDYNGEGVNKNGETVPHKYGCSGIDGICFAPLPGSDEVNEYFYVAYGIYSDDSRSDNDHQVLLCYETEKLKSGFTDFELNQMHRNGPEKPDYKFFVYTGNTAYGVQNMTYDSTRDSIFLAVYKGNKTEFENYDVFAIDMTAEPVDISLNGLDETGLALTLLGADGPENKNICGWHFDFGEFGFCSNDSGGFYIGEPVSENKKYGAYIYEYDFDLENGFTRQKKYNTTQ